MTAITTIVPKLNISFHRGIGAVSIFDMRRHLSVFDFSTLIRRDGRKSLQWLEDSGGGKSMLVLMNNAVALTTALLNRGQSVKDAAKEAQLSYDLLCRLCRRDREISFKTACRLRQVFGNDTVKIQQY